MADDAISAEQWNELLEQIRRLSKRIKTTKTENSSSCMAAGTPIAVVQPTHSKAQHPGDPGISDIERVPQLCAATRPRASWRKEQRVDDNLLLVVREVRMLEGVLWKRFVGCGLLTWDGEH